MSVKNITGGAGRPPGGVGRAPRPHIRILRGAAAAAPLVLAAGVLLAACGGSSVTHASGSAAAGVAAPTRATATAARAVVGAPGPGHAATLPQLLARVLPGARLLTVVDLRLARAQLRLGAHAPLGDHGHRGQELTQLGLLALPLIDDHELFAGLDLSRITAAVQFGGVAHSGLLIASSETPAQITAGLERVGWRRYDGGFRYARPGGDSDLSHSQVDLFNGGLVLAYTPADAEQAARQTQAPRSDRRLLALVDSSGAPARFAAIDSGCLRSELAQERLSPHVGSIVISPRARPRAGDLTVAAAAGALSRIGLVIRQTTVGRTQVLIKLRYGAHTRAPAGTIVELARVAPLYRCRRD
jgi:hypothetical protein